MGFEAAQMMLRLLDPQLNGNIDCESQVLVLHGELLIRASTVPPLAQSLN
jgi:hypothetical protein